MTLEADERTDDVVLYDSKDLTTHAVISGLRHLHCHSPDRVPGTQRIPATEMIAPSFFSIFAGLRFLATKPIYCPTQAPA